MVVTIRNGKKHLPPPNMATCVPSMHKLTNSYYTMGQYRKLTFAPDIRTITSPQSLDIIGKISHYAAWSIQCCIFQSVGKCP